MTTVHLMVGTYAYTAHYTRKFTKPVIDAGKREMCKEPLHKHHDGCPSCDINYDMMKDDLKGSTYEKVVNETPWMKS
jgi:hypothetical protein